MTFVIKLIIGFEQPKQKIKIQVVHEMQDNDKILSYQVKKFILVLNDVILKSKNKEHGLDVLCV